MKWYPFYPKLECLPMNSGNKPKSHHGVFQFGSVKSRLGKQLIMTANTSIDKGLLVQKQFDTTDRIRFTLAILSKKEAKAILTGDIAKWGNMKYFLTHKGFP